MVNKNSSYKFTNQERNMINELIKYSADKGVESSRILKGNKNITNKFEIKEDKLFCSLNPKGEKGPCEKADCPLFNVLKRRILFKNTTFIHSHLKNLPLSFGDVLTCLAFKMKKMIAVTLDGKFSMFIPNYNSKNFSRRELYEMESKLTKILKQRGGVDYIFKTPNVFEKYKADVNSYWQNLAAKTGSKYITNL